MMCRSLPIFIQVPSLDPIQAIIPIVGTICSGCYQRHTGPDGSAVHQTHLSCSAKPCRARARLIGFAVAPEKLCDRPSSGPYRRAVAHMPDFFSQEDLMDKLTAIKGALCITAAVVSTSVFGDQLSRGELSNGGRHTAAPETADEVAPLPDGALPADKGGREGKALPSKIELEIDLTMRRLCVAGGRHRAHRSRR
jgi:hypothetical protein